MIGWDYTEEIERKKLLKFIFRKPFCTKITINRYGEFTDIKLVMIKLVLLHCFSWVGMLVTFQPLEFVGCVSSVFLLC